LAEIAASGRAAVLIPLPTATDDHQQKNAQALAQAGAAELLDQRELTGERLAGRILALLDADAQRAAMAKAVRAFARPDAAQVIVDRALQLIER
jgi:UDP-N-acetylglucosamine--N-acetylmuramyl-(pentapeptide) pyrophosphoryl-undecaprenol N-acetylglucosamine transferase